MKCRAMSMLFLALTLTLSSENIFAEHVRFSDEKVYFEDFTLDLPLGLEAEKFYVPADNPISREKVELGRALFYDERLSRDDSVSCSTCHSPDNTFTDNLPSSMGIDLQEGDRSAPTIINRAFSREQFWDGRAASMEEQAKGPLINPIEMGMPSHDAVVKKVSSIKGYRVWFRRVFEKDVNIDDIARAIAAFERTLLSGDSRMDRFTSGDKEAFTEAEKRGLELFRGKARCNQCHSGFNFTDEKYHNIGVGWESGRLDLGRYMVTGKTKDIGTFKTPTLRDIAGTAPYMHDGSMESLEEVVEFYDQGGFGNPFLDVEMRRSGKSLMEMLDAPVTKEGEKKDSIEGTKLNLTTQEKADLITFLNTLDGKGWQNAVAPVSFPK
ncbi:MAG: cytochrome-c peroxidase [Nitrospinota bacterium]